jgi:heptosyltransferase-3
MTGAPAAGAAAGASLPAPRSVLVIVTRRIGDVLLATPLIRSLKLAWPGTAVDALVFSGTEGMLAANPDLRRILAVPARPTVPWHLGFLAHLWRRYDIALSLLVGTRPTLYALAAGRRSIGLQLSGGKEAWKRRLLDRWVAFDNLNTHTVRMHLALAEVLGIPPRSEVVAAWSPEDEKQVAALTGSNESQPLAVLHPYPKYPYKMWHRDGWIEIARWLSARGLRLALTGSGDPEEVAYVGDLARALPAGTIHAAGRLSLGASACLVSRARIYVGLDTAMTHIAAALGVPTAALYGPTNPVKWGPWPRGHAPDANPWRRCGSQQAGNVTLIQGLGACVPCHLEGCERHISSTSDCLQQLPAGRVIAALEQMLARSSQ